MNQIVLRTHQQISPWFVQEALKRSPVLVGANEVGDNGTPHTHFIFEYPVGPDSVKKLLQTRCKELNLITKKGQENKYYGSCKEAMDVSAAIGYAFKHYEVDVSNARYTQNDISGCYRYGMLWETIYECIRYYQRNHPTIPITATDLSFQHVIIKTKPTTMRQKFIKHMENEGWVRSETNPSSKQVYKEVFNFFEWAFTNPQGIVICRHALYYFSDDDAREIMMQNQALDILKSL